MDRFFQFSKSIPSSSIGIPNKRVPEALKKVIGKKGDSTAIPLQLKESFVKSKDCLLTATSHEAGWGKCQFKFTFQIPFDFVT